jgi:putative transposase
MRSLSFVQRVLRRYRKTGETTATPRGATLALTLSGTHLDVVKNFVTEQQDALLQKLCERLRERTQS